MDKLVFTQNDIIGTYLENLDEYLLDKILLTSIT